MEDWQAFRKQRKAGVTGTVIDGIRAEALKAGISLQDALAMCCQRGWTGFKAEWVGNGKTGPPNGDGLNAYQRMQVEKHEETKRFTEAIHGKRTKQTEPIDITPGRLD